MGCKYKTAEAQAKHWLRGKGVIDKYLNIIDYPNFKRRNWQMTEWGRQQYNIDTKWFFEENNKAIPNKEKFREVDRRNNINYDTNGNYYQLVNQDNTKADERLDAELTRVAEKMGITVMSMEQYKAEYKDRIGEDTNPIAVADVLHHVIAYDKNRAGITTLSEEIGHLIIHAMWGDPLVDILRGRDAEGNVINPYLRSSKYWTENYQEYIAKYQGNEDKVEREVLGKMLADKMVQEAREKQREGMPNWVRRLYELFDRLLGRFFKNMSPEVTMKSVPEAVEVAAGKLTRKFFENEIQLGEAEDIQFVTDVNLEKLEAELLKAVEVVEKEIRSVSKSQMGLYKKEIRDQYNTLVKKYGKETVDNLQKRLEELEDSDTPASLDEKIEIMRLLELEEDIAKDKQMAKRLSSLYKRLKNMHQAIKERNFDVGLYEFIVGEEGMVKVLDDAIKRNWRGSRTSDMSELQAIIATYEPHIDAITFMLNHNIHITDNKELKRAIHKGVKDAHEKLRRLKSAKTKIRTEVWNASAQAINKKAGKEAYSGDPSTYTDIGYFSRFLGDIANVANPIAQRFIEIMYEVRDLVQRQSQEFAIDYYMEIQEALGQMPDFGYKIKGKALYEMDENGDPTGYLISEYLLGGENGFLRAKQKFGEEVVGKVMEFARKNGIPVPTSSDPHIQSDLLKAYMYGSDMYKDETQQTAVMKYFKEQWALWHLRNTTVRSDFKDVIAERKANMTETQFKVWEQKNIRKIYVENKTEKYHYTIYSGELSIPSDGSEKEVWWKGSRRLVKTVDWTNPQFKERIKDPAFRKAHDLTRRSLYNAKSSLSKARTMEEALLLPQISRDMMDVLVSTDMFKGLAELIGDQFLRREDDVIRPQIVDGLVEKNPAIRFLNPLANPKNLSTDIVKIMVAFEHMKNEHVEQARRLPELTDLLAAAKTPDLRKTLLNSLSFGTSSVGADTSTKDVTSNLEQKLEHFLNTHVYGSLLQDFWDDFRVSPAKVADRTAWYVRSLLLLGNYASSITGLAMASIQNLIEAMVGEYTSRSDYMGAKWEYMTNFHKIVKDYQAGVKSSKITAAMQEVGILDSIPEAFSNLNKWKASRVALAAPNYGFWRAMDHTSKTQGMIAVAKNIRLVDGEWKQGKNQQWDLTKDERWKKGETLWDHMTFENGRLEFSDKVTDSALRLWKNRSLLLAQRLDQKPDAYHNGTLKNAFLGSFLTMFMGWMYQGIEMRFKKKMYMSYIDNEEEGYYRSLGRLFKENFRNSLVQVLTELMLGRDLGSRIVGSDSPLLDYTQVNARKRVLADLIAMTTVATLAATFLQKAWDDDEDDYVTSMMAYISSRLVLERSAFLNAKEFLNYADNPVAGIEYLESLTMTFGIFGELFRFLSGLESDDDIVRSGIYKGYTQHQKKVMKSIPLFRGFYENIGAGTINQYMLDQGVIDKATTTTGTAPKLKARYITSQVINKGSGLTNFPYLAVLSQMMGIELADMYMDIQREGAGDFPVKSN